MGAQWRHGLQLAFIITAALLVDASSTFAIPILTPHPHRNPGTIDQDTTWINPTDPPERIPDPDPDDPDHKMHQHRDRDPLTGGNGKYIGQDVWDNREYRRGDLQPEFGHGYMDIPARYLLDGLVPADARTDFDSAVDQWETAVNGNEINVNGVPITISINFDPVTSGAHEIDVFWRDIGAEDSFATAFWDRAATDFTFDSDPTIRFTDPGNMIRLPGAAACTPTIQLPSAWYFGGVGAPPNVTDNYDICNADGSFTASTFTFAAYDFYTIALHEIGHSWGLAHFGTGIMRTDISSFVMRAPDGGSIDGVKDLYAIPSVPEPSSLVLCFSAAVLEALRRRKRAARAR